ncbi:MAG: M14 family zinc carboxypeptidase [Vulcanimicrobiota bacterium]
MHPQRATEAAQLDSDGDGLLDEGEILGHLGANDERRHDARRLVDEFGFHLRKSPNPVAESYPSGQEVGQRLADLERAYPALAQRVSLGQSAEGRDIWALKISEGASHKDTSARPGVVLTGVHHAREWMSLQPPLKVAQQLLEGYAHDPAMRARVEQAEIWVVPVVNPDGYEFSRNEDNMWKKNRRPVGTTACRQPTDAIGTDLNRNYLSPRTADQAMYRPPHDTPCSTADDVNHTSDDPHSPHYRGPSGNSEPEVQALLGLELGRGNVQGVLDHHGYGEMILYPWSHTTDAAPHAEALHALGERMNQALASDGTTPFKVMQSSALYPNSGSSDDVLYANGVLNFTLEVGRSYQPPEEQIEPIATSVARADLVFIDAVIERARTV